MTGYRAHLVLLGFAHCGGLRLAALRPSRLTQPDEPVDRVGAAVSVLSTRTFGVAIGQGTDN